MLTKAQLLQDQNIQNLEMRQFLSEINPSMAMMQSRDRNHQAFTSKLKNHVKLRAESMHSQINKRQMKVNSSSPLANLASKTQFKEKHPDKELFSKSLAQFDKLCLDQFLKVIIVGENKVSQKKSTQIIRSLNGTWFKEMNIEETHPKKMVSTLGIRKGKSLKVYGDFYSYNPQISHYQQVEFVEKQAVPPQIFPSRKTTSAKRSLGQCRPINLLMQKQNEKLKYESEVRNEGNFKKAVMNLFARKNSKLINRSPSQGRSKKVEHKTLQASDLKPFTNALICSSSPESSQFVRGVKMVLHH